MLISPSAIDAALRAALARLLSRPALPYRRCPDPTCREPAPRKSRLNSASSILFPNPLCSLPSFTWADLRRIVPAMLSLFSTVFSLYFSHLPRLPLSKSLRLQPGVHGRYVGGSVEARLAALSVHPHQLVLTAHERLVLVELVAPIDDVFVFPVGELEFPFGLGVRYVG